MTSSCDIWSLQSILTTTTITTTTITTTTITTTIKQTSRIIYHKNKKELNGPLELL